MTALLGVTAGPASANDVTLNIYKDGVLKARATYDDLYDKLCIKVFNSVPDAAAYVAIGPVSGTGPTFEVSALGDDGWRCTGNLSIPEDRKYEMDMKWRPVGPDWIFKSTTFYT